MLTDDYAEFLLLLQLPLQEQLLEHGPFTLQPHCGPQLPFLHLQPVFLRGLRFVNRFWALTRVIRGFFDASKDDVRTSSRIGARSSVSTESAFGEEVTP
jgi:hypothetical protein